MPSARLLFISASFACLLPFAAMAADAPPATAPANASDKTPVTRAELPDLIRQTLMDHPEMIIEAVQKAQANEQQKTDEQSKENLKKHKAELMHDTTSPSIGPKTADVTIVEFFDYHCGFCKHLLPTITQLVHEDKNVRVIFKEFPILAEDSITASHAALAVNHIAPDKYFEFHTALMKSNEKFDEAMLLDTAKKLGIDSAKLKTEMNKAEISAELEKDRSIGEDLGIRGTPALIIGNRLYPGAVPYTDMKQMIAEVRAKKNKAAD